MKMIILAFFSLWLGFAIYNAQDTSETQAQSLSGVSRGAPLKICKKAKALKREIQLLEIEIRDLK